MKKNRGGKEVETYDNNYEENYREFPCQKHPNSSTTPGGICAYCLTDRLYQIVCSQCGELSSTCSCTGLYSSNTPNSSSSSDVGHFGRISFLLENEKANNNYNNNSSEVSSSIPKMDYYRSSNAVDYASLRRCNSVSVGGGGRSGGDFTSYSTNTNTNIGRKESKEKFWKIGRLFRTKKEKSNNCNNNGLENTNNNECNGVPRSRSVSSFREFNGTEGENGNFHVSTSAARASSVSTGNFYQDSAKMSCFSESEARFSNFDYLDSCGLNKNHNHNHNNVFMSCDDPGYIDLKLHDNSNSNSNNWSSTTSDHPNRAQDLSALRRGGLGMSTREFGNPGNSEHQMLRNSSCRRSSVTERELRKCRKSSKVMKWFFNHQSSIRDRDEDDPQYPGFHSSNFM